MAGSLFRGVGGRLVTEGIADARGFLLGRKTYDIFASYWPKITDPNHTIATALNSRPKYVVSRSLERVTWNNSSLIKGDVVAEIRKLRQQPAGPCTPEAAAICFRRC